MWILLFIALILILLDALMLLRLGSGLVKASDFLISEPDLHSRNSGRPAPEGAGKVTLIVPFRNEIRHLPRIVKDLEAQTWPEDGVEFILVNDHSEDGSGSWAQAYVRGRARFSYMELTESERGKKSALAAGVRSARGDWIIQTDADCSLGPEFVAAHMAARSTTGADLVAGLVTTQKGKNGILERLERLDLLGLAGVAAGSFALGRPLLCSGANLSYSRELYLGTRAYDPVAEVASGDDMFMMIGARKLGGTLVYLTAPEAVVSTEPVGSLQALVRQRIRWGAKAGRYRMPDIQAVALLTLLTHFVLLLMPWLIWLRPEVWVWLIPGFAARTFAQWLLLYRTAGYTGQRCDLWMFLPVLLFYYPFMALVMTGSLFKKGKWKY